ncbi:ABC-2 type transporter family protein [Mycobacterium xenopi 3993]|nr:ABC-2 type transporter family protein [Mycobacterium xenopi 3993]
MSTSAYLGAKILVFGLLAAVQTAFVTTVVVLGKGAPARGAAVLGSGTVELYVTVATTAIVSVIVGLVLSAVARYKQLLLPIVVLVVLLSLVFSGGMFPLAARDGFEQVSWLFPSGGGSRPGFHHRPAIDRSAGRARRALGHSAGQWLFDMAMLFVFAVVGTGLLWWWLRPPSRPRQVEARVGNDARFAEYSVAGEFGAGIACGGVDGARRANGRRQSRRRAGGGFPGTHIPGNRPRGSRGCRGRFR